MMSKLLKGRRTFFIARVYGLDVSSGSSKLCSLLYPHARESYRVSSISYGSYRASLRKKLSSYVYSVSSYFSVRDSSDVPNAVAPNWPVPRRASLRAVRLCRTHGCVGRCTLCRSKRSRFGFSCFWRIATGYWRLGPFLRHSTAKFKRPFYTYSVK